MRRPIKIICTILFGVLISLMIYTLYCYTYNLIDINTNSMLKYSVFLLLVESFVFLLFTIIDAIKNIWTKKKKKKERKTRKKNENKNIDI